MVNFTPSFSYVNGYVRQGTSTRLSSIVRMQMLTWRWCAQWVAKTLEYTLLLLFARFTTLAKCHPSKRKCSSGVFLKCIFLWPFILFFILIFVLYIFPYNLLLLSFLTVLSYNRYMEAYLLWKATCLKKNCKHAKAKIRDERNAEKQLNGIYLTPTTVDF
jgi:hypothetical protein